MDKDRFTFNDMGKNNVGRFAVIQFQTVAAPDIESVAAGYGEVSLPMPVFMDVKIGHCNFNMPIDGFPVFADISNHRTSSRWDSYPNSYSVQCGPRVH